MKILKPEELIIEQGKNVSNNVLSLKNLAAGYRTYKKITKDKCRRPPDPATGKLESRSH